jgi:Ran-binding protein 1
MVQFQTVIVNYRAKLFVFGETLLDKGTGKKTWRERGIGDVKILQHKENKKYRILMRQEKTMKPICNHVVDPRIEMQPQMSSDKAMMWSAFDFSEGELVETIFAMRFSNSDIATEFKKKFEDIQAEMKKLLEAEEEPPKDAEAEAAADETAEKLATLTTSE